MTSAQIADMNEDRKNMAVLMHEVDHASLTARVGTTYKEGPWLELGTRRIAARPWLRRRIFGKPMGH